MKEKILTVDDEASVRRLIQKALGDRAYEVLAASEGAQAMRLVRDEDPALVLLDLHMAGKDGWEVLQALRRDVRMRAIPVILLTGDGDLETKIGGLESGADDYITKPFAIPELVARVESVLRRNRRDLSANPLTKLPGSPSIEEEVNRRIREGLPFAFLYADIDRFKSYNDAYGYERGDEVIREAARIVMEGTAAGGESGDFVGHIGGDDFVIICRPESAPHIAWKITERFDAAAPFFYPPQDRKRGGVTVRDRRGVEREFPIVALSVGIVSTERRTLDQYGKVAAIASEMKGYLKSQPATGKSRFAFDRRQDF